MPPVNRMNRFVPPIEDRDRNDRWYIISRHEKRIHSLPERESMAKDGYLIFDSDTHVGPNMDVLTPYLSEAERKALEPLEGYKRGNRYMIGERKYDRRLGD